jgi:3-oxoacyl-[acyl-carrier-protein] synthase II
MAGNGWLVSVVVTGLGTVNAAGCGREHTARMLAEGAPMLTAVDRSAGYHRDHGSRTAVLTGQPDISPWIQPMAARRMCPSSRYAVAAAQMALEDAGLDPATALPATAVVMSTAYGSAVVTEKILRQILFEGPEAVSPALFTESVANAPAAQVALACGATGTNVTVTQRQAGPLIALAKGFDEVNSGRAPRALVGAVDELNPMIHAILDRFGALARDDGTGIERARPFDRDRHGFLGGDGATVVVLEAAAAAHRRGAPVLARVLGSTAAFDPSASRISWGREPEPLCTAPRRLLGRLGLDAEAIGCVVTGGCGTPAGDRLEALVLRSLWDAAELPPALLAPKATMGEHGGAVLAAAVLAASGASFAPTPGFATVDPELGVTPYDGSTAVEPDTVLVSALAAGGAAAWSVLGPDHP